MSDEQRLDRIHWNDRLEEYFAATGEKAHCFSWLHKRAEEAFSRKSIFIDLPVIVLSTLNGAVSVGSSSLFGNNEMASVGVGAVALLTAILSTIGSYFAFSRRAESHRAAALNYAKLYRFLSVELSLPRRERMPVESLLKYIKTEYDRLSEISPLIPPAILDSFRKKFRDIHDIAIPEECNGLHAIIPFKGELVAGAPPVAAQYVAPVEIPVPAKQKLPTPSKDDHAHSIDHTPHLQDAHDAHAGGGDVRAAEEGRISLSIRVPRGADDGAANGTEGEGRDLGGDHGAPKAR
jgi:hypothetical protein